MSAILTFLDGDSPSPLVDDVLRALGEGWSRYYPELPALEFRAPVNLKRDHALELCSEPLRTISKVRNPDVFFSVEDPQCDLGGIEITVHSPDGSNADKRYPYLWSSRREGRDAFIVCPYQKTRTGGQVNRIPFRHAERNRQFLMEWSPRVREGGLRQILPMRELQTDLDGVPRRIGDLMWDVTKIGEYFAHRAAMLTAGAEQQARASAHMRRDKRYPQQF